MTTTQDNAWDELRRTSKIHVRALERAEATRRERDAAIYELSRENVPVIIIAKALDMSRSTVHRIIKTAEDEAKNSEMQGEGS